MLELPLKDADGNELTLIRTIPSFGVDIVVKSKSAPEVRFNADAYALRALSLALSAAADFAERVAPPHAPAN